MNAEVDLELNGELDFLRLAWQAAECVLDRILFEEDEEQCRYNLLLAIQEALTNSLRHGYGDEAPERKWIGLRIRVHEGCLRIEIRDRAFPFDPTVVPDLQDTPEGEVLPEGGYGLRIIRAVTDRLTYRREEEMNVLVLEKQLLGAVTRA